MTNWPYEKIEDHEDIALSRFTQQYEDAENLKNLVRLSARRTQALEEVLWDLLRLRNTPLAVGEQLDRLGRIVGERRLGRSDSDYRSGIILRITLNRSSGDPETIIEFLRALSGAETVIFKEVFPASLELFVNEDLDPSVMQRIRSIVPVAVGSIFVATSGGETPFGTQELTLPTPESIDGFGELGIQDFELYDGSTLEFFSSGEVFDAGLTDFEDPVLPTEGGAIAEVVAI